MACDKVSVKSEKRVATHMSMGTSITGTGACNIKLTQIWRMKMVKSPQIQKMLIDFKIEDVF